MRTRFEKFEMKYGYFLSEEFKKFMQKFGGDTQFGSCRFEYSENIANNLLRVPGKMNINLLPFGDIGNGDYYCFYKYGPRKEEYYIGIWLHETRNFIVLASNFKSFMYKCLLDDIMSLNLIEDDSEYGITSDEILYRINVLSEEFGFDVEKAMLCDNEYNYHKFLVEYDNKAIQSLCFLGKKMIENNEKNGKKALEKVINEMPIYTAPYYILGKHNEILSGSYEKMYLQGLKTSLDLTGFSYWEEDFIEIPEDVHREMLFFIDEEKNKEFLKEYYLLDKDPYDAEVRLKLAKKYVKQGEYEKAVVEYNNALYCNEDKEFAREILKIALNDVCDGGLLYLKNIIENDLKFLR
ncbi:hypothetical protein ABG79_00146 [Caloramator mitchellensis]|uniref:Knr4/Smi1-like domain-containing protein n=1 Tax=Caloramator mitchellensis TaxID=908809 RepID=A0A0R3K0B6_CALMK|nr:SMI1/KNR4 family protein [Caloramator mitchellensis]KRQ87981.1 hypothetical protein ABG79_00146 [Caloramator mitchellensis]